MGRTHAVVVGAGIAGLATSAGLRAAGCEVTLLERATSLAPVGAGITLAANAVRVLDHLGVGDAVRAAGRTTTGASLLDGDGRPLLSSGPGGQLLGIHRADLQQALLDGAPRPRLGTTVTSMRPDEDGVSLRLDDGGELRADIVVGADGINSRTRQLLLGDRAPRPVSAGYAVWRLVVEDRIGLDHAVEQWGRGRRVGAVPLPDGRLYAFLVENLPVDEGPDGRLAGLRRRFADFGGPAAALLASLPDEVELLLHDVRALDGVSFGVGRVALVGDAAHAITPNLGQGAAQALEDVPALVAAATRGDPRELAEGLDASRRRRVTSVASRSATTGRVGQWSGGFAVALRDAAMRALPTSAVERAGADVTGHDPLTVGSSARRREGPDRRPSRA